MEKGPVVVLAESHSMGWLSKLGGPHTPHCSEWQTMNTIGECNAAKVLDACGHMCAWAGERACEFDCATLVTSPLTTVIGWCDV